MRPDQQTLRLRGTAGRRHDRVLLAGFNWVVSFFFMGMYALLLLGLLA